MGKRSHRELNKEYDGLALPHLHADLAHIETQVKEYVFAVRRAVCRKVDSHDPDDLSLPQNSVIEMTSQAYLKELLLGERLKGMAPDDVDYKLLDSIVKASRERHTLLLKLGLSERDNGTEFLDFGDSDTE